MSSDKLILKYLNKSYEVTRESYRGGGLVPKGGNAFTALSQVVHEVQDAFNVTAMNAYILVERWWHTKIIPFVKEEETQALDE